MKRALLILALAAPLVVSCGTSEDQSSASASERLIGGLSLTKGGLKKKRKTQKTKNTSDAKALPSLAKCLSSANAAPSFEVKKEDAESLAIGKAVEQKADTSPAKEGSKADTDTNWIIFDEQCEDGSDYTNYVKNPDVHNGFDNLVKCNAVRCSDGSKPYQSSPAPIKPIDTIKPNPGTICNLIHKLPSCIKTDKGYTVHDYTVKPGTCDWLPAPGEIVKSYFCKGLPGSEGLADL